MNLNLASSISSGYSSSPEIIIDGFNRQNHFKSVNFNQNLISLALQIQDIKGRI